MEVRGYSLFQLVLYLTFIVSRSCKFPSFISMNHLKRYILDMKTQPSNHYTGFPPKDETVKTTLHILDMAILRLI